MEDVRHKGVSSAKLTGHKFVTDKHVLLECLCPSCNGTQYHTHGKTECIYCEAHFMVSPFQIVQKPDPDSPSGEFPGPNSAA